MYGECEEERHVSKWLIGRAAAETFGPQSAVRRRLSPEIRERRRKFGCVSSGARLRTARLLSHWSSRLINSSDLALETTTAATRLFSLA
jgi:hypothetical protein